MKQAIRYAFVTLFTTTICLGCNTVEPSSPSVPTQRELLAIRESIQDGVTKDKIRRYAWDDQASIDETFTRVDLCQRLLNSHRRLESKCTIELADCLRALRAADTLTEDGLNRWAGLHRATDRSRANPDDAVWKSARWVEKGAYWQQDVHWTGEAPRRGWNRADARGLWGWDPKLPGAGVGVLDDDGQRGWLGLHVGYPFSTRGGCACILWLTPKEAYLECLSTEGIRTAAGLWGQYQWQVSKTE